MGNMEQASILVSLQLDCVVEMFSSICMHYLLNCTETLNPVLLRFLCYYPYRSSLRWMINNSYPSLGKSPPVRRYIGDTRSLFFRVRLVDSPRGTADPISVDLITMLMERIDYLNKRLDQIDQRYKDHDLRYDQRFQNLKNELREDLDERFENRRGDR